MGPKKAKKTKKQLEEEKSIYFLYFKLNPSLIKIEKLEEEKRIADEIERKKKEKEEIERKIEEDRRQKEEEKLRMEEA